jgi:polysaccharide deacetylase 2 family uncharacterized protein YibQ
VPFDEEDRIGRPIGLAERSGRLRVRPRQVLTALFILALGGLLGTAGYFLSTLSLDQITGFLDVGDRGPRLVLTLPAEQTNPAGGGIAAPPPVPAAPPPPRLVAVPATPQIAATAPIPSYTAMPPMPAAAALPPAPAAAVSERTAEGTLPRIGTKGQKPWQVYARPFAAQKGQKLVAVVVSGLGLDRAATEAAIHRLPADVTLAFDPYGRDLVHWAARARAAGHEILVQLPVGGPDTVDPGALGLRADLPTATDLDHLRAILARVPGAIGVLAPKTAFTGSAGGLAVMKDLARRGLAYVGNGAANLSDSAPVVPVAEIVGRDLWPGAIDARLHNTAEQAKSYGAALVVLPALPITLDRLSAWMGGLAAKGLTPAPVSALAGQTG